MTDRTPAGLRCGAMRIRTLAVAAALTLAAATPAHAVRANAATFTGVGVFGGLGLSPTSLGTQPVAVNGTLTLTGTQGVVASYGCALGGTDTGTLAASVGSLLGTCGPVTFVCTYTRAGVHEAIACAGPDVAAFLCAFSPVAVLPTTAFTLTCLGAS